MEKTVLLKCLKI